MTMLSPLSILVSLLLALTPLVNLHAGAYFGRDRLNARYQAARPEGVSDEAFSALVDDTVEALQARLDARYITNALVTREGTDKICVEIERIFDPPEEILALLTTSAHLEFKDPDGNVFMTGEDIKGAGIMPEDSESALGRYVITLQMTDEGTKIFAEMTEKSIGKNLTICLDGETLIDATVNAAITEGAVSIEGSFTYEEARDKALLINLSLRPLPLTLIPQKNQN